MSSKILEILRKIDEASSRQECFSVQRLTDELRVLLAAPVVERRSVGHISLKQAPPELAELQATIDRMAAEIDLLKARLVEAGEKQ